MFFKYLMDLLSIWLRESKYCQANGAGEGKLFTLLLYVRYPHNCTNHSH